MQAASLGTEDLDTGQLTLPESSEEGAQGDEQGGWVRAGSRSQPQREQPVEFTGLPSPHLKDGCLDCKLSKSSPCSVGH